MAMASPFSPSSNLALHHLREVGLLTIRPAEVEESSNTGGVGHSPASAAIVAPNSAFSFRGPQTTVYAAAYCVGGGTSLCPEEVLVTALPVNGPTPQDAEAAMRAFELNLNMTLRHSSSRLQVVSFWFLEPAEGGDQNFVDPAPIRGPNYIPDLNVSPPEATAPATEFVGEIKSQNVSRFIDYVVCYMGEQGRDDEVAEYRKILSCKSEAEIRNLDSIRVWNILTLRTEIQKALVAKGLVEAPIGRILAVTAMEEMGEMAVIQSYPAIATMAVASPFSPSSNLVRHHLREVGLPTIRPAEVEESSNTGGVGHSPASAAIVAPNSAFSFRGPQTTVYAVAYCIGGGTSLCPEEVLVTALPVNGPTLQDAEAAMRAFKLNLNMTLRHSSSRLQVVSFWFLEPAEGGDQNFVDPAPIRGPNYIPDLNVSPPEATAPATEFVGEIKSQNVSRFIDYVVCYLGEQGRDDEVAEYRKILSSKSEAEIRNLDSIRVWNYVTLETEIQKALVAKGLVEAPIGRILAVTAVEEMGG